MNGIYRGRNTKDFYLASALYDSIEDLNLRAVLSLIQEKHADPNIILPDKGISPFHLAIGSISEEFAFQTAKLILQNGGDPNVRSDEGLTPLHIASAWGREDMVRLLLNNGADPQIKDYTYQTAADYAFEEEHKTIYELIKDCIDTDIKMFFDNREQTQDFLYALNKVLVNNGQAIGEYGVVEKDEDGAIDLKVLPQTTPDEYVKNWCNNLESEFGSMGIVNGSDSVPDSALSNSNGSSSAASEFHNITTARPKPHKLPSSGKISDNSIHRFVPHQGHTERVSGVASLPDSLISDCNADSPDDIENVSRISSIAKAKDTSSDYFTCTDVSENVLEQNIYEISSISSGKSIENNEAFIESGTDGDLSFVSVSEVYKYTDKSEGIVLYEKRVLPPGERSNNETDRLTQPTNSAKSSFLSSLPRSFDYDTDALRKELTNVGFEPGPITTTTKRVYLRKLYNLKKNPCELPFTSDDKKKKAFSIEIQKTLKNSNWTSDLTALKNLEESVSAQFSNPDPKRKWREGVTKSSFTYLLLDPRVTQNFPCRSETLSEAEQWEVFLSAIFYVGKGKRSRPYQHLYEAISLYNQGVCKSSSKKLQRILDIWNENQGVICLHIFQNVIPAEAYTREAAMISALKLENLENIKTGDFYGIAATWSMQQKRNLGVYLLYKAMKIFKQEGERQLSPNDID